MYLIDATIHLLKKYATIHLVKKYATIQLVKKYANKFIKGRTYMRTFFIHLDFGFLMKNIFLLFFIY